MAYTKPLYKSYFVNVFKETYISINFSTTGHNTWWGIEDNKLFLSGYYVGKTYPTIYSIYFSPSLERIDKSKELIDILKDNKW